MEEKNVSQSRTCPTCGSALSDGVKWCAVCGMSIPTDTFSNTSKRRKYTKLVVAIGCSVGVLICVLIILFAIKEDMDLAANVAAAADQKNTLVSSNTNATEAIGNQPGILAAGGLTCEWNDGLLLALADGIYYHAGNEMTSDNWQQVVEGSYSFLNVYNKTLYAIQRTSSKNEVLSGSRIVEINLENLNDVTSKNIYSASSTAKPITFLARKNDALFLICSDGKSSSTLVKLDLSKNNAAEQIYTFSHADVRFYCTERSLTAVHTSALSNWIAEQSNDDGLSWSQLMSGTGQLASSCLIGNDFYYSTKEGSLISTLKKQTLTGAFQDFSNAKKVSVLAGIQNALVTKSSSGQIGWINPFAATWHDLSDKLAFFNGKTLSSCAISLEKNWAVIILGNQAVFADMNGKLENIEVLFE